MATVLGGGTFTREGEQRVFGYAVLASIALHAALLFANFHLRDAAKKVKPAPGPIVARLVAPRPVAAPAPVEPAPKPRVEEPPPPVAKPQPAPVPIAKAVPKAPVVPAKPAPAAPSGEAPKSVSESAPPVAPSAPSPAPPSPGPAAKADPQPAQSPTQAAATDDSGTLAQYRLAIIMAAKRYRRYPRVALDNNWEGRVDVRILFGVDGKRVSIVVLKASGHEILDRQAIDTVAKAFVPVPASMRGKEFTVDIPVIYNLKDEASSS
jgi:protein TonB